MVLVSVVPYTGEATSDVVVLVVCVAGSALSTNVQLGRKMKAPRLRLLAMINFMLVVVLVVMSALANPDSILDIVPTHHGVKPYNLASIHQQCRREVGPVGEITRLSLRRARLDLDICLAGIIHPPRSENDGACMPTI